jgi:hypothetical protein
MPDYYGGVAQAGAQMMNSGLNAMTAQKKLEADRAMQEERIAAQERMMSQRVAAGGGSFSGNDPVSKGARSFNAITSALNAHSDEQINLMNQMSKVDKTMEARGYGTDEDNIAKQRLQARMQNNDYAMKMMTKSLGGGKFEYNTTDADGSTVKAVFDSAADLEAYKSMFKGNTPEIAAEKNTSILSGIFGDKTTSTSAPRSQPSSQDSGMSVTPVSKSKSPSMSEQVDSMMQDSGVDQPQENPAAKGGSGRRVRTKEDIANENADRSRMKIESLKKEFESLKGQKNAKGNVNTAAMRRIAADIIEEEKNLKSGN